VAELAGCLDREIEDVENLMALHQRITLRSGGRDEEGASPVDQLSARRSAEPSRCAQAGDVHDAVERWILELSDKQRAVVERRFGLHGHRRSTLEQIGKDIGVTRERVRQIQLGALKRLRELLESHGIVKDSLLD
jgi:RNA polymerase nonessential primary-like sigma factor